VSIRKFLLLPGLIRASVRLRRQGARGWEQFWSGVHRTGPGGEVLWDVAERTELDRCLHRAGHHFDPALPVVDLGCGNGRFTRLLATRFPVVVGVDMSASAIRLVARWRRHPATEAVRPSRAGPHLCGRLVAQAGQRGHPDARDRPRRATSVPANPRILCRATTCHRRRQPVRQPGRTLPSVSSHRVMGLTR
jgi:hypothetical protein